MDFAAHWLDSHLDMLRNSAKVTLILLKPGRPGPDDWSSAGGA